MKVYGRSLNPELLSFWYEHAAVGRIGLVHIDIVTARLIGWAERRVTADGEPSPWAHVFVFIRPRSGVPWIAESDLKRSAAGISSQTQRAAGESHLQMVASGGGSRGRA